MSAPGKSPRESEREIPGTLRVALKEGMLILLLAVLFGLAYTALTQKGLFGRSQAPMTYSLPEGGVPETITVEEARELHSSDRGMFIDTRGEEAYNAGHIPGAINIPLSELEAELAFLREVSSEKVLIPYCDGSTCHSSREFASRLVASGIFNVKLFFGGWEEWKTARLPTAAPLL